MRGFERPLPDPHPEERQQSDRVWHGLRTVRRLFFLRPTSARVFGELTSVSVAAGEAKTYGPVGPFEHRFLMSMDVSPRDEVVFVLCHESPRELWMAKLR